MRRPAAFTLAAAATAISDGGDGHCSVCISDGGGSHCGGGARANSDGSMQRRSREPRGATVIARTSCFNGACVRRRRRASVARMASCARARSFARALQGLLNLLGDLLQSPSRVKASSAIMSKRAAGKSPTIAAKKPKKSTDSTASVFDRHPTVIYVRENILRCVEKPLEAVASAPAVPHGGFACFSQAEYKAAMAPGGSGEYVCVVRACDIKFMAFAHGPENLPAIGASRQSWKDHFQTPRAMSEPIAVLGGTALPKMGQIRRQGSDAYFLSWLLGWAVSQSTGDKAAANAYKTNAASVAVRFMRAETKLDIMAVKWRASKTQQALAANNALHGIRLSIGILDQFEAYAQEQAKKTTIADTAVAAVAAPVSIVIVAARRRRRLRRR